MATQTRIQTNPHTHDRNTQGEETTVARVSPSNRVVNDGLNKEHVVWSAPLIDCLFPPNRHRHPATQFHPTHAKGVIEREKYTRKRGNKHTDHSMHVDVVMEQWLLMSYEHNTNRCCYKTGFRPQTRFSSLTKRVLNRLTGFADVHVNEQAVRAAVYFSSLDGEPPQSATTQWIIEWGSKFIHAYKPSEATTTEDIQSNIQQRITQFHSRTGPFESRDLKRSRMKSSQKYIVNCQLRLTHLV